MAQVIMLCGISGSGKTTYALEQERAGYRRLSIDETIWKRWGRNGVDYPAERFMELSDRAEVELRTELEARVRDGEDVILDFCFCNAEKRQSYRALIAAAGGTVTLVYLKADIEVLRRRLRLRNERVDANAACVITDEMLERYYRGFQAPQGEGEVVIVQE